MTALTEGTKRRESSSDGEANWAVFTIDGAGCVSGWNAGAQRLYGYLPEEIGGQPCSLLWSEDGQAAAGAGQWRERALGTGRFEAALWCLRKDGTQFQASVLIAPLRDPAGTLMGFAHVARDLSGRLRMAHDFNNFTQVTGTAIEALRFCLPPGDGAASRLLDTLKRNVDLAAHMMLAALEVPSGQPEGATQAAGETANLAGLRVLVIEDESLIAMHVESLLEQLGCKVIGFAGTVESALASVQTLEMDVALLDMNLHGARADQVAQAIKARGVPLVFMSGDQDLDEEWRGHAAIRKPFQLDQMRREIERAVQHT